ncbi:MAG TPA: M15 family metallopeptidase [Vicingaceae bacterium]
MEIKKKYVYVGIAAGVIALGVGLYLSRKKIYEHFDYKTDLLLLSLDPKFRKKIKQLLSKARDAGMELRVISAYRDCTEQNKLYAKGRTAPGKIVTNAKCGKSSHNYKKAVDVVEFKNGQPLWTNPNWEKIGQMGEALGLEWGGRWTSIKDKPHFQDLAGKTIASLYREYERTGILAA